LQEISGIVPSLREAIPGCAFAPRCGYATARCMAEQPPFEAHGPRHHAACWEVAQVEAAAKTQPVGGQP
jgi:peptide/nickel transport system ATP-binding protein